MQHELRPRTLLPLLLKIGRDDLIIDTRPLRLVVRQPCREVHASDYCTARTGIAVFIGALAG
jgi:hypothetical protein